MSTYSGLTSEEARTRLDAVGRNELVRTYKVHLLKIILSQFTSPLILILVAAAAISLGIGLLPSQESNFLDAMLIMIIVLVSGIFGTIQDYKSEKTIEALQSMAAPKATVVRDGEEIEISSIEVVPGDLLLLEPGDMVTADGELLETFQLEVDESILTGESKTVRKRMDDNVYANTYVTSGNARVKVTETGMQTRLGLISSQLQEIVEEKSPFQRELVQLGKTMSILTLFVGSAIFVIGLFKFGLYGALLTAISLVVAAIPEGLPAVVVLALAIDARALVKKNALIRKLSIVESIGAIEVICTDKTGTLTKNEMTVVKLYYNMEIKVVPNQTGEFSPGPTGMLLLQCGMLCNNSSKRQDQNGEVTYVGEQTEIALRKASEKFLPTQYFEDHKKVSELAFNSERKMMSVITQDKDKAFTLFSKGAPEVLIRKCDRILVNGETQTLTAKQRRAILHQNKEFAKGSLRILGFAYKPVSGPQDDSEENLIWIGLQAMIDPPGEEVAQAVRDCRTAGIRVIMVTGDNPDTALAIAGQVGMETRGVIEGTDLEDMDDALLAEKLNQGFNIYARTDPFHKLRILEILQKDHNVAMTGDGVNDALAIKKADVGIAMGRKGTEVAKQASDMILLDDNFKTIRDAIREGRKIFNNIRKFINYLLTCNFAEVAVIFLATLIFTLQEPVLFPVQILWINLLTDGLVALALGVDPPTDDIMLKKPRKKDEPIINNQLKWLIALIGTAKTIILLLTFYIVMQYAGVDTARSVLFAGFVLYEFVRIASIRYLEKLDWSSNKWLLMALFGSLALQLLIIYTPVNQFFHVQPFGINEWAILLIGSLAGFLLAVPITRLVIKKVPG